MRIVISFLKVYLKVLLGIALWLATAVLLMQLCMIAFIVALEHELDEYSANRPKTSIEQTQKNLPVYLEKINEILEAHDMPLGKFRIINGSFIAGDITFDDAEIDISISNYSDSEEIKVSFRKYYKNVERLEDLVPPTPDEYGVICEIMQSIVGENQYMPTVDSIERDFKYDIFDKENLRDEQPEFQNRGYFEIERDDMFTEYGSLWTMLYVTNEKICLRIVYSMPLENNEK